MRAAIAGVLDGEPLDAKTKARLGEALGAALGGVCDGGFTLDLEPLPDWDFALLDWQFDAGLLDWQFADLDKTIADMQAQDTALLAQLAQEPENCPFCGRPMPGKGERKT